MCASTSVISIPGYRRCTRNSHKLDLRNIDIRAHLKFSVSGQSKQASIDTHTHVQRIHASVGLALVII